MSETPYSKAWAEFIESEDGKDCNDASTLEEASDLGRDDGAFQRYLTNRLKAAFEAGWNGSVACIQAVIKGT